MPRLACSEAKEMRFTLGDYERRELIKPIGSLLVQADTTAKHARYLGYATIGIASVSALGAAWFIGKGISGAWDNFKDLEWPLTKKVINPDTGEETTEWSFTGIPGGPLWEWVGGGKVI